ncbi:glycoside hydrolase family 36 protein [Flagellimonas myxillae]|uniref:glycoside hydrolase family 36 protein n=1 Tax=Flagellimonas myxillae TaxID=2942214 RepID=UPI00201EEFDD|nr:glycoside hydrolase family 36 protein [Muricauda myxillae]MCL6267882.1 alpha-galactosidase [Muricauda myxillae]
MTLNLKRLTTGVITALFCVGAIAQNTVKEIELAGQQVEISGDFSGFDTKIEVENISEGLDIATITLSHESGATPPKFTLKWNLPSSDIAGHWGTGSFNNKNIGPSWSPSKTNSMLAKQAPVIVLFGHDDINRLNFSVSEALNTVTLSTGIKEEDGKVYNQITFFTEKNRSLKNYEVKVRFDSRPQLYSKALNEVADWWASFELYTPAPVPEVARLPVYSSWYSYHQKVSMKELVAECKLAKKMGFESIIVDDGWQTLDSNRGYAYTGDWEPERIPEMKEFVQAVHDLGMKFILWYAVPFAGENSKAYEKMKGKFLRYWNGQGTYVLDPRYPEVREFIINTYVDATREWNLDGFKLDFIGRFVSDSETELTKENGRDYASVNEATDVLMTDLMKSLQAIKPDIMIEFRQPYIGPAMRKYGNMFRATDCPNLSSVNRIRTSDLRMLSGNTAVHSDMLMWHYDEPVEVAALQMLNVMYSVPQISVRLEDIPQDHFKMIKFYTDYWLQNRDVLLDGEFHPTSPLTNYPILEGSRNNKKITTVFNDQLVKVQTNKWDKMDILNAKRSKQIILLKEGQPKKYAYVIRDCMGNQTDEGTLELNQESHLVTVPPSGLISLTSIR